MTRIFTILATLALLAMLTASAVWADPLKPRYTWTLSNMYCTTFGRNGTYQFYVRANTRMRYVGTSANRFYYSVVYPYGAIPMLCPNGQMGRPR